MKLVFPNSDLKNKALLFKQEFIDNHETSISGDGGFFGYDTYENWLDKINYDLTRDDGFYMPASVYFALINEKIVGVIQIRYKLNDYLFKYGGHIGYSIVPSERRKGYATQMLSLGIIKCREFGIGKILITCDKNNIASAKTIIKNNGKLENEVKDEDNKIIQRYWI